MTAIPSMLSKSRLQASKMKPNCSAVPVAKKSIGFPAEEPLNNFNSSFFALTSSKGGTSIFPSDKESVSMTAGPPAWVTMAMFFPFRDGYMKIPATVANSSRPLHRTMPAFRNKASTAISGLAKAPVWEEAARLPAAEPPDFTAAMRHPLRMSEEACFNSFSGFSMLST